MNDDFEESCLQSWTLLSLDPLDTRRRASLRSSRPSLTARQSSFSKRHSSLGTPSEVPFPSLPPELQPDSFLDCFADASSSDASSTRIPSRPSSPRASHRVTQRAVHKDHELLALPKGTGDNGTQSAHVISSDTNASTSTPGWGSSVDCSMHSSPSIDDLGGQAAVGSHSDSHRFSPDRWNSDQLRPPLFYPPHSHSSPSYEQPSSMATSEHEPPACARSPPHSTESYEPGALYTPRPNRPTSSSSLPLPTQTPYSALPTVASNTSHLPRLTEHVQLEYASPRNDSASSTSSTDQRSGSASHLSRYSPSRHFSPPLQKLRLERHSAPIPGYESASPSDTSSRNSTASSSLPPPTPPTVLDPTPPPNTDALEGAGDGINKGTSGSTKRSRAPYEPFLSQAPPPADSYISVETTDSEYRLIVRLPGFRRDCIMLSTRRRRMLHICADSWEAGGGHFERRISFGYDADLAHVRAEFDGEHLRVVVPRKNPPVSWFGYSAD